MSESAQLIDEVVRQCIAPLMKSAGYRKSGRTWYADKGPAVRVVNVQGSAWNSPTSARFTVNLGVWFEQAATLAGGRPVRNRRPPEYSCTVRNRIGFLLDPPTDTWWTLTGRADVPTTGEAVRAALEEAALPWLERVAEPRAAIAYLSAVGHAGHSPVGAFSLALAMGDRRLARELYADWDAAREPGLGTDVVGWAAAHGLVPE